MYQMYAYQKKYNADNITLLYPQTDKVSPERNIEFISNDGAKVCARFVDLFNVQSSLTEIVKSYIDGLCWRDYEGKRMG